jgi:hypothetical protein
VVSASYPFYLVSLGWYPSSGVTRLVSLVWYHSSGITRLVSLVWYCSSGIAPALYAVKMQPSHHAAQLPLWDEILLDRRILNSLRLSFLANGAPNEPVVSRIDSALICDAGKKPTLPPLVMPDQHHES